MPQIVELNRDGPIEVLANSFLGNFEAGYGKDLFSREWEILEAYLRM